MTARDKRIAYALLFAGIAVALFLRFDRLTAWPLWLDEAFSAFGAEKSFKFIWTVLPTYETHPPLFTTILRCWQLLTGQSAFAYRLFGVLISLATMGVMAAAARELAVWARRPALPVIAAAVAMSAVIPVFVEMARLVRPYYLMMLVYAAGIWAVLRIANHMREDERAPLVAWSAYIAALALLIWFHNLGPLYSAALGLALLLLAGPEGLFRHHWKAFLVGHALAAAAALPAVLMMLDQAPTWRESTWLGFRLSAMPQQIPLLLGLTGTISVALAAGLAWFAVRASTHGKARMALAFALLTFFPVICSIVLSMTIVPVFLVRTLTACSVPMVLIVALGMDTGVIQRVAFAILLIIAGVRTHIIQGFTPEQNWYPFVRWLAPQFQPGDIVYAYPNEGALPFSMAMRHIGKSVAIRPIPSEIPARDPQGWYPTGNRGVQSLKPERLAEIAADPISRKTRTIWLLRLGKGKYDKGDAALKAFAKDRDVIVYRDREPINVVGLRLKSPPPEQPKP